MRAMHLVTFAALLLASATASAGGIYQWKDAKGVTHYTDTPPPDSQYKQRNIYHPESDAQPATNKGPAENPACATARLNITTLQNSQTVRMDSDGDGKPDKTLGEEDRASQKSLAEAAVKAYCPPAN